MGESAKRKDLDATTIQSNKDDEELLYMFIKRACNELMSAVALRFPYIGINCGEEDIEISFDTESEYPEHLLPMLQQAVTDYIVNEATMHWLLLRRPEMAHTYISLRASLCSNVLFMFAKIYNTHKIRRRATDLAGI